MKFAIGVVTYNDRNLHRLFQSLNLSTTQARRQYHQFSARLIGVDNGDPIFSLLADKCATAEGVELASMPSQGNIGFAAAMNRLMAEGFRQSCDYFIAVNPDGIFHANCLCELLKAAEKSPNAVLEARQFPEEHAKFYDPDTGLTSWVSGACVAISREVYERIGGFDANFFLYCEDVDFSWRAQAAGFETRMVPDALFAHETFGRIWSRHSKRHFFGSRIYLAAKWGASEFVQKYKEDFLQRFGSAAEELAFVDSYITRGIQAHQNLSNECKKKKPSFDELGQFSPFRWSN
jgi:GT2 family glycosyltransferase